MRFNYSPLAKITKDLLTDFGKTTPGVLNRYTYATAPNGDVTPTLAQQATGLAFIVLPASKGSVEAFDNRRDELLMAKKILRFVKVAALGCFEPLAMDELVFDSKKWEVLGCTPVNPSGEPLVYGIGCLLKGAG